MLRLSITLVLTLSYLLSIKSQDVFNKVYDNKYSLIINHIFHTTDSILYACEYQNFRFGAGGMVTTKINKNTGSKIIIDSLYQENEYIGLIQKPNKVFFKNRMLYYLVGVDGTNLFSIDTSSGKVINEFIFNSPDSTKYSGTSDLLTAKDTIILLGWEYDRVLSRNTRSITWIHNDWHNTILIPNTAQYFGYNIEKAIELPNRNFLTFGKRIQEFLQKLNVVIAEVDRYGKIIHEVVTPDADFTGDVQDFLQINDDEYIILCLSSNKAPVHFDAKYYHTVYRYNHKTRKIVWRHRILEGLSNEFGLRSSIIAGHKPNEYLYAGMVSADLTGQDTTHTEGRIVKLNGNGSVIWAKSYTNFVKKGNANSFYDIISSDTSHYYASGTTADGSFHPWLIKIDEDGNLVPIDTTSNTSQVSTSLPEIKIYPNPTTDYLLVNQGEIENITYELYNINGKLARSMKVEHANSGIYWQLDDLPSGQYILAILKDSKILSSTVIIKI